MSFFSFFLFLCEWKCLNYDINQHSFLMAHTHPNNLLTDDRFMQRPMALILLISQFLYHSWHQSKLVFLWLTSSIHAYDSILHILWPITKTYSSILNFDSQNLQQITCVFINSLKIMTKATFLTLTSSLLHFYTQLTAINVALSL